MSAPNVGDSGNQKWLQDWANAKDQKGLIVKGKDNKITYLPPNESTKNYKRLEIQEIMGEVSKSIDTLDDSQKEKILSRIADIVHNRETKYKNTWGFNPFYRFSGKAKEETALTELLAKNFKQKESTDLTINQKQYRIGKQLETEKKLDKARIWYQKASEKGHSEAQAKLTNLIISTTQSKPGVYQDAEIKSIKKAIEWQKKLVKGGKVEANLVLGKLYFSLAKASFQSYNYDPNAYNEYRINLMYATDSLYLFIKTNPSDLKLVNEAHYMLTELEASIGGNPIMTSYEHYKEIARSEYVGLPDDAKAKVAFGLADNRNNSIEDKFKFYLKAAEFGHPDAAKRLEDPSFKKQLDIHFLEVIDVKKNSDKAQIEKALNWFKKWSEKGDTNAYYALGVMYRDGVGVEKDISTSQKHFESAGSKGHIQAQFNLGRIFLEKKEYSKAVEWYTRAADQGDLETKNKLGNIYYNGTEGVPKNRELAETLYREAADKGHKKAQLNIGHILHTIGKYEEAHKYYKLAEAQGDPDAMFHIAELQRNKQVTPSLTSEQINALYKKSADLKYIPALTQLGFLHQSGAGVSMDKVAAFKLYKEAAENGHGLGQLYLAQCYHEGIGTSKDLKLALEWYEKAGKQGYQTALLKLGNIYLNGEGIIEKDVPKGLAFYEQAAKLGNLESKFILGNYFYRNGTKEELAKGIEWLREAAKENHVGALINLGDIYSSGYSDEGIKLDPNREKALKFYEKKGFECYERAAEKNLEAQWKLGLMYLEGKGVDEIDVSKGFDFIQKAADQNYPPAIEKLGDLYYAGQGVAKNTNKALEVYKRAIESRHNETPALSSKLADCYFLLLTDKTRPLSPKEHAKILKEYENYHEKVFNIYQRQVDQTQDPEAQHEAEMFFAKYFHVKGQINQRDEWLNKATQDPQNLYLPAVLLLGQIQNEYRTDISNPKNLSAQEKEESLNLAISWFTLAAKKDDCEAMKNLGKIYLDLGKNEEAISWYLKAAHEGDAEAQRLLADLFTKLGQVDNANKLYLSAAEQGDLPSIKYLRGIGWLDEETLKGKVGLLRKAAEQGDVLSQKLLGDFYLNGIGLDKNTNKAEEWYKKAVDQNNTDAEAALGIYYMKNKNIEKGFELTKKAGLKGALSAQTALINYYLEKRKIFNNYDHNYNDYTLLAFEWFEKAAKQDRGMAAQFVRILKERINQIEYRDKAQALELSQKITKFTKYL